MYLQPTVRFFLPLLCVVSTADTQQRKSTPYGLLYREWKAEVAKLEEEQPALSKAERRVRKREINEAFTPRFQKLATQHLDDDLWIDCLIWTSVEGTAGPAFDRMFDILGDNAHRARNSLQLTLLMSEFIKLRSDSIDPALKKVADSHPENSVKGAALYALAARTKKRGEQQGDFRVCQEAEALLKRVVAEFPDVHTYRGENRENATQLLQELRSPVAITKPAPDSHGETVFGEDFDLALSVKGKVAVISFSGHWCSPCVAMHPVQKELLNRYPADILTVVEINSDQKKSLDDVRSRLKKDGLNWTVVADGSDGPISKQWHVSAWPTYYVLDVNGRIRYRLTGNVGHRLIDLVAGLIPQK